MRLVEKQQVSGTEHNWEVIPLNGGICQLRSVTYGQLIDFSAIPWTQGYVAVPEGKEALVKNWIITPSEREGYYRIISETEAGSIATIDKKNGNETRIEIRIGNKRQVSWWKMERVDGTAPGPAAPAIASATTQASTGQPPPPTH